MTAGASGAAVHRTDLLGSRRHIGPYERHVQDPSRPELVYGAYLSLLHAVGGARPGERLALRAADLDALLPLLDPHNPHATRRTGSAGAPGPARRTGVVCAGGCRP